MSESETFKKGWEIRRQLIGDKAIEEMSKTVYNDPIMDKFAGYAGEAIFGLLWARPGLDLKTKTLICCITDTSTARWPELKIHLRMARRQGWTEDELAESLIHTAGYIGVPFVREALITAKETFAELREEGELA